MKDVTFRELESEGKLMLDFRGHREYIMGGNRYFVNIDPDTNTWIVMGSVFEDGHKCEIIGCQAPATYIQNNIRACISHLSRIRDKKTGNIINPVIKIRSG